MSPDKLSSETPLDSKLIEEYVYGGFIIRHHRYKANLGIHHIVCFNPRDGDLLQEEQGISVHEKLTSLISDADLLKIYGRKVYRPVIVGNCMFGFNEPVVSFHTSRAELVEALKDFAQELIQRYETGKHL